MIVAKIVFICKNYSFMLFSVLVIYDTEICIQSTHKKKLKRDTSNMFIDICLCTQ